jgi:N-acetylneuraminic acid mutarotase
MISRIRLNILLIIFLLLALITCKEDEVAERLYPSIDTREVTEINQNGAKFNAEILSFGNSEISDHGFVYEDVSDPTIQKSERISLGAAEQKGSFSVLANRVLVKNKKYYVKAYSIVKENGFIVYGQQVEFISQGSSSPEIIDINPKTGVIGDTVILIGSGFSNNSENNLVTFSGALAKVIKSKQDSIWVIAPLNSVVGENLVTLLLGQITTSANTKFILKTTTITSISPTSASFGDTILIEGVNFSKEKNFVITSLFNKNATTLSANSSLIKAIVPEGVGVSEAPVIIKQGSQTLTSTQKIKLLAPVVTNFLPIKGTKDTEITINGNYFSTIPSNNIVEINGTKLTVTQATKTMIKAKLPSGITPGSYSVVVTVTSQMVTTTSKFEVVKPVITAIAPLSGTWDNIITITGENFGFGVGSNIVKFGTVTAEVISANSTELKVKVPPALVVKNSLLSVLATTIDNQVANFSSPFVLLAPVITSFTPNEGKSKSVVTISGQNFNPIPGNQIVKFGDRVAEVVSASVNQLTVKLPTSLEDTNVNISVEAAEQIAISSQLFHLVSAWKRIADLPGARRSDGTAFSLGSFGYVGGGNEQDISIQDRYNKKFWRYNPNADSWNEIATFVFPFEGTADPFLNMVSFSLNGFGYTGLGSQGGWPQWPEGRIRKYDPTSDTWGDANGLGNFLTGYATDGAVAYSSNGKGYVTTGREKNDVTSKKLWEYDPTLDSWTRKPDLPGSARMESTGFSLNSKIYVIGGTACVNCTGTNLLNDVWLYDILLGNWRQLKNFPGDKRMKATGFAIDETGYMLGGESYTNQAKFLKDLWKYDTTADNWIQLDDFPGGERVGAVVFVIGNKAYYGTGFGQSDYQKDFWEFDPSKL